MLGPEKLYFRSSVWISVQKYNFSGPVGPEKLYFRDNFQFFPIINTSNVPFCKKKKNPLEW